MTEKKRQELIEKLRAVVVSRGATEGEEASAKRAITRLQASQVEAEPEDDFAWMRGPNPLFQALGAGFAGGLGAGGRPAFYQHGMGSQQRAESFEAFLKWIMQEAARAGNE